MHEKHTAENIAGRIEEAFAEHGIRERLVAVVTDGAPNMVAACRFLDASSVVTGVGSVRFGCLAHKLQLVVSHAIEDTPEVLSALTKCRELIAFFNRSHMARKCLGDACVRSHLKIRVVLQEVQTRWSSTYFMLRRLLRLRSQLDEVITSLEKKDSLKLLDSDPKHIDQMSRSLAPFANLVNILEGEHYATLSLAAPLMFELWNVISEMEFKGYESGDAQGIQKFRSALVEGLNTYWVSGRQDKVLMTCAALDPRFKSLRILSTNEEREQV
jgi:hypothetical protein